MDTARLVRDCMMRVFLGCPTFREHRRFARGAEDLFGRMLSGEFDGAMDDLHRRQPLQRLSVSPEMRMALELTVIAGEMSSERHTWGFILPRCGTTMSMTFAKLRKQYHKQEHADKV